MNPPAPVAHQVRTYVGVDVGATKTALALGDEGGRLRRRRVVPTVLGDPAGLLDVIVCEVEALWRADGIDRTPIGVGICGGVGLDGRVSGPLALGWSEPVDVAGELARRTGADVHLDNDVNAGAMAEHRWGAGRDVDDFVYLALGTGIGAGLVLRGELYRGVRRLAGEIGHLSVDVHGDPCACGNRGCIEASCGGKPAADLLTARLRGPEAATATSLHEILTARDTLTTRDLFDHAARGDAFARAEVDRMARLLAAAIVDVVNLLDVARVVVGGGQVQNDVLLPAIHRALATWRPYLDRGADWVVRSELGDDAGVAGAVAIAIEGHGPRPPPRPRPRPRPPDRGGWAYVTPTGRSLARTTPLHARVPGPRKERRMPRTPKVRPFFARLALALLTLAIAGAVLAQPVTLRLFYPGWDSSDQEAAVTGMIAEFEAANPDITIEIVSTPFGVFQERLFVALRSGEALDVGYIGARWLQELNENDFLMDMSDVMADLPREDWIPGTFQGVETAEALVAIADRVDPWVIYTNERLLEEAGITECPATTDDFIAAGKALTHDGVAGFGLVGAKHATQLQQFANFLWAHGGHFVTEDGSASAFDSPEAIAALDFYANLFKEHEITQVSAVSDSRNEVRQLFFTEQVAMFVDGPWAQGTIDGTAPNIDWGVCPIPQVPGQERNSVLSAWYYTIFAGTDHPEEAARFVDVHAAARADGARRRDAAGALQRAGDGALPDRPLGALHRGRAVRVARARQPRLQPDRRHRRRRHPRGPVGRQDRRAGGPGRVRPHRRGARPVTRSSGAARPGRPRPLEAR